MGPPTRSRVAVQSLHITGGRIGWLPQPGALVAEVTLPQLDATASGPDGTMLLNGTLISGGRALTLNGEIGSLGRLFDSVAPVPWPVRILLHDQKASLDVSGAIAQPMRGRGLGLQIEVAVDDFSGLEPFFGNWPVPHDATLSVHFGDDKGDDGLTAVTAHLGRVSPGSLLPGVDVDEANLSAPGLDRPVHVDIKGSSGVGALRLVVNTGNLATVMPGAHPVDPVPVDIQLDAGRALFSVKGTVADPMTLKGVDADVFVRVPELATLSELAGRPLPALSEVAFDGHVFGDLHAATTLGIRHATVTVPQAQLTGDADVRIGPRPFVHAVLTSQRIDLDSLIADLAQPWGPPAQAGEPAASKTPPLLPVATPAPAPAAAGSPWLIPDKPIDFAPLDLMDADLNLHVDSLQAGGVTYSQVGASLLLRDGKAVLDPLVATFPGGQAELQLSVDSQAPALPVTMTLRAPSLRLAPIVAAAGVPGLANGSIDTAAELHGAGHSLHAIAASLDGHLGLQSVDAEFDNRLVLGLLKLAKLPEVPLGSGGTTRLRCLAVRLDVNKGVASVGALVADLQRLVVIGGGSLDLGQEQFALQLRPTLRLGNSGGGIVVPVRVGGGFLDPKVASETGGKGGPAMTGSGAADPCVPALAAAAASVAPKPKPVPEADAGKTAKSGPATAVDVLKELIK
jgi:AsmA protein